MTKDNWSKCVAFHGHECPGLAIGVRVSEAAIEKLKIQFSLDEEIVCITENDSCSIDAVQVLLSCTVGKGNLILKNLGKQVYSFYNRNNGDKIRIVLKPMESNMDREERKQYILGASLDELFEYKVPKNNVPNKASIFKSIICEKCGENTAESKIRLEDGKKVCLDCYREYTRGW